MNRTALIAAVYERTGLPTDDGLVTSSFLNGAIQQAIDQYSTIEDWPWLQSSASVSVTAGTTTYAVPADWARTRFLRIDQWEPLTVLTLKGLYHRWPYDADTGRPIEYAIDAEGIVLRPFPDAAYTMTHGYQKSEPVLASGSDSPLLPVRYHYALVEYVTWLALRRTRDEQRGGEAKQAFGDFIRVLRDDQRRIKGPVQVRIRGGSFL